MWFFFVNSVKKLKLVYLVLYRQLANALYLHINYAVECIKSTSPINTNVRLFEKGVYWT